MAWKSEVQRFSEAVSYTHLVAAGVAGTAGLLVIEIVVPPPAGVVVAVVVGLAVAAGGVPPPDGATLVGGGVAASPPGVTAAPGAGVVTGLGRVCGRLCMIIALSLIHI